MRPERFGFRNSKPSVRRGAGPASTRFAFSRSICFSFDCACRAFVALAPNRSTKRSSRAISSASRSAVFAACWARAACSRRQTCHLPGKNVDLPRSSSSTAVVTASRNQRSWATRITAASIVRSSSSSHSIVSMSRWFVGSSRSSRSGWEASARASEARVSSPPENVASGRSRSSSTKPSPRTTDGRAVAPVVAAGVLEARLSG